MTVLTRVQRRIGRVFFGWWIVAGAIVIQMMVSGLLSQSYGAYIVPMQAEFGWAATVFAGASAVQQVENGILGPIQGYLLDRFGTRAVLRLGHLLFAAGFFLFSRVDSVQTFYLAFACLAVGTSMGGYFTLTALMVNWFRRYRTTAMGLAAMGISFGGLIAPLVASSIVDNGWRQTAFGSAIIVLAVGLPISFLMRHRPEQYGYLPDGDAAPEAASLDHAAPGTPDADWTTAEAMRSPAFWYLNLGHASAILIVSTVFVYVVPHITRTLNVSIEVAASAVAVTTMVSIAGQLIGGVIGDRFDKRWIAVACMAAHVFALVVLANATAMWMVYFFAVVHGIAWGIRGPLMQALRADYFGRSSFAKIAGFSSLVTTIGSISGPAIVAILADQFGNYRIGFLVLAGLAALGTGFFVLARPPRRAGLQPRP